MFNLEELGMILQCLNAVEIKGKDAPKLVMLMQKVNQKYTEEQGKENKKKADK
jgi:hypothetical protein